MKKRDKTMYLFNDFDKAMAKIQKVDQLVNQTDKSSKEIVTLHRA